MEAKLNTVSIFDWLEKNKRPMSWLAGQINVSPSLLRYRIENRIPKDIDAIAKVIGISDPKKLIVVE